MQILQDILFTIITACGVAIATRIIGFVNHKIDEVQANTTLAKRKVFAKYIDMAQDIVSTAVLSVTQTYVDDLKKEGKFDGIAAKNAKESAIAIAEELLNDEIRDAVSQAYGDVSAWIIQEIEKNVQLGKDPYIGYGTVVSEEE